MVARSDADAIGLNFYSRGKRYVDPAAAEKIVAVINGLPENLVTVGVFVNATVQEIIDISQSLCLNAVQLHGDESPDFLIKLKAVARNERLNCDFIRAIRTQPTDAQTAMNLEQVHAQIDAWVSAGIDAILIDAAVAGDFGGTGKQVDWAGFSALKSPVPKILAGGLTPKNVAQAIVAARPAAVDVASGVELSAGRKDARKTQQFSALATQAFA